MAKITETNEDSIENKNENEKKTKKSRKILLKKKNSNNEINEEVTTEDNTRNKDLEDSIKTDSPTEINKKEKLKKSSKKEELENKEKETAENDNVNKNDETKNEKNKNEDKKKIETKKENNAKNNSEEANKHIFEFESASEIGTFEDEESSGSRYKLIKERFELEEILKLGFPQLLDLANEMGLEPDFKLNKQELIFRILKLHSDLEKDSWSVRRGTQDIQEIKK